MFKLTVKNSVKKDVKNIKKQDLQRIARTLDSLKTDPLPRGVKKIKGGEDPYYRIRQGDYRIGYRIDLHNKAVEIIFVKRRAEQTYR